MLILLRCVESFVHWLTKIILYNAITPWQFSC